MGQLWVEMTIALVKSRHWLSKVRIDTERDKKDCEEVSI